MHAGLHCAPEWATVHTHQQCTLHERVWCRSGVVPLTAHCSCSVLHHLHMHILSLLFPVAHYFLIISYVHDYSPFASAFTLITLCLIVLLYPCSIVVVFCCYAPVYITLCTSCNNLQSQFNHITLIVILMTRTSLGVLFALPQLPPDQ